MAAIWPIYAELNSSFELKPVVLETCHGDTGPS